ncbi:MAG: hypothetical protein V1792_29730 [Pseudomonadota bacterium]
MEVYAGIDLHSTNSYVAVIDAEGKKVHKKRDPKRRAIPGKSGYAIHNSHQRSP